jgi:hypothetical protein
MPSSSRQVLVRDRLWRVQAEGFAHILSTFPVFARKRPEFYTYLLEGVAEWAREG